MKKTKYVGATIGRPHFKESVKSPFNKGAVSEADWGFSNKGITLIALIITIIVMLILVMVSIQIALNTGLFDTAGEATGDWTAEQEREQELASGKVTIGNKTYNSIDEYVNSNSESKLGISVTLQHTPKKVIADGTYVGEIVEEVPIPVDFYYVGGIKNTGIVISDNLADKNAGVDADLQGNQFVWVPVQQNQRIKIEARTETEITGITIKDPLLREITTDVSGNTINPSGTNLSIEVNPTINGTYTVKVETEGEGAALEAILKVTTLYAEDYWIDYGEETVENALLFRDSTKKTYLESVNEYGGFYIARYEAGTDTKRNYLDDTLTETIYSKKNMYPYNNLYESQAKSLASKMYEGKSNITSVLINRSAWSRTVNWLVETKAITEEEVVDSTTCGNHKNSTFTFSGKCLSNEGETLKPEGTSYLLGTGVAEYTRKNNIYDLAGNVWEFTMGESWNSWGEVYVCYAMRR